MPGESQVTPAADEDRQLVRRTAEGHRESFEELVRRHHASVLRLLRGALPHQEDAEDAAQETFLSAYRAAAGFRGDASVRTWLLTIARHVAYHQRVKSARHPEDAVDPEQLAQLAGWGTTTPEHSAMHAESREHLMRGLSSLAPDEREVLILRDLEGLSGEQTADILHLSLPAMKSRLHRARLRLSSALRPGGAHATR